MTEWSYDFDKISWQQQHIIESFFISQQTGSKEKEEERAHLDKRELLETCFQGPDCFNFVQPPNFPATSHIKALSGVPTCDMSAWEGPYTAGHCACSCSFSCSVLLFVKWC